MIAIASTIDRLRAAMTDVLADKFDSEIRALVDSENWYSPDLSIDEVFNLWAARHLERSDDALWVFQPLRVSERRYLCEKVGIQRSAIIGKTPEELAKGILTKIGLPVLEVAGNRTTVARWNGLLELIERDEGERAAVLARQLAERTLRKVLYFYCSTRYGDEFVSMLENPGSLRVHNRLASEISTADNTRTGRVANLLREDGWADLGFLTLALRKYSERLTQSGATHVSGGPLRLFTTQEHEAFSKLGTSLQPYTHDRPSKEGSMKQELRDALLEVLSAVGAMISRAVFPDGVLVLEVGHALVGPIFKALKDSDTTVYYRSDTAPAIGKTVLLVPSTNCNYAFCQWVESPW
jgi:hypothetical protein